MFNGEQLEKISKTFCEELNRDKQPLTQLRALAEYLKYVAQLRKDQNQQEYANIINTIFAEPIKWILKSHHFDSKEVSPSYSSSLKPTHSFSTQPNASLLTWTTIIRRPPTPSDTSVILISPSTEQSTRVILQQCYARMLGERNSKPETWWML